MQIKRLEPVTVLIRKAAPARMLQTLPEVTVKRPKSTTVFKEVRPWA